MQMTGGPFTGDLRKIMDWLFRGHKRRIEQNGYFGPIEYHNHPQDIWWTMIYQPVIDWSKKVADKIGIIQSGYANIYALHPNLSLRDTGRRIFLDLGGLRCRLYKLYF